MGFVVNTYRKNLLRRFDKDGAIPYYSPGDFPGLSCKEGSFKNSAGVEIKYFTYCYAGCSENKLILFCPGMGPGHTAYLTEIETICRAGFRVLTLDYTGCGESGGERLTSANAPTRDIMELLALLDPCGEIIPVGHSLGGYTALNIARLRPDVKRAVIISGFVSISDEMMGYFKLRPLANLVKKYEIRLDPEYGNADNRKYLAGTTDRLLWFHSTDDPMVNYRYNAGQVISLNNPNIRVITVEHKKHNPNYSAEALETMNAWMGQYKRLISEKQLNTPEERKAFFADKPIGRMTSQDPAVISEILQFVK
ncbi:MAG: alpha/beta hydrolase [Clostridia bacterium]|nr:alpha/beta hydrolase [Clostridia bacterium]